MSIHNIDYAKTWHIFVLLETDLQQPVPFQCQEFTDYKMLITINVSSMDFNALQDLNMKYSPCDDPEQNDMVYMS